METNAQPVFVGIDVSKDKLDVALWPSGESFTVERNARGLNSLCAKLAALNPVIIALEATGGFETVVAAALAAANLPVAVVNPAQIRAFAHALGKRAKTDPIDAVVIARFAEAARPAIRPLADAETQLLADLIARRRQIVEMIVAEKQRLGRAPAKRRRTDINSLKRQQAELDEARVRAEAADRAKSQFLANVSHEIRTPLNGIIGFNDMLLQTELTARQREYSTLIQDSSNSLMSLIDEILDLGKIERGALEIEALPFKLSELVAAARFLEALAGNKSLKLEIECSLPEDMIAVGDVKRIRQILVNLLGNAIKFTEAGCVRLAIARESGGLQLYTGGRELFGLYAKTRALWHCHEPLGGTRRPRARRARRSQVRAERTRTRSNSSMNYKHIPRHRPPLLPQILSQAELARRDTRRDDYRLEMLLRHLWQTLFETHGSAGADRLPSYIVSIDESKGFLTIEWRNEFIMHRLRPAVKLAWGLLDVAYWQCKIEITHWYPDGITGERTRLTDEYSSDEADVFSAFACGMGRRADAA